LEAKRLFDVKAIWDLLKGRSGAERAKISAYVLAPGLLLGWSISGAFGGGLSIDLERPITISELKTEVTRTGDPVTKQGIVLIVEPVVSEYRIQLGTGASKIWTSLDEQAARANADRLVLDRDGLKSKTPFIGVNGPVTVVVDGNVGTDIQVPGGTQRVEDWRLSSRRSSSIVSSVLLACVFAFGMSLATGLPSVDSEKETAS
jgi:hypothetical protein